MKPKLLVAIAIVAWSGLSALAGDVTLKVRRIYVDDNVYTPYYNVDTEQDNDQGASQRWLRLAVEYSTSGGWIDELKVDHMALVPNHGEEAAVLDETVTYLNIGPGNHVSYVYMHPNCVKRYESRAKEVDMGVTFSIEGKTVAHKMTNKNKVKDWMQKEVSHTGHLLDESETPFWFVNYDYKEMIKHRAHNGHDTAHH